MTSNKSSSDMLVLENVTVDFGTLIGLDNINLYVKKGEIHAIIGDHGAGKSTLVNVISGMIPKTSGRMMFDGRVLEKHTPENAIKLGINTLYQDMSLWPGMTAFENIFLNREIKKYLFFNDDNGMRKKTLEAFAELSLDINPDIPIKFYSIAQQQLIELARIICFPSKLLVIDEISNRFLPKDLEKLHYIISMLRRGGTTVLYVCSNMDEIFNFANQVSILNDGKIVETADISNIDNVQLVQLTYSSMYSREQLEKSNLELFYLTNFHKNIINSIPIPLLVTDSKDLVVMMNGIFETFNEVRQADFIGKPVKELFDVNVKQIENADTNTRSLESYQIRDVTLKHCSRSQSVSLHIIPVVDEDNSFMGKIYLLVNTEEHAEFEGQIQQYKATIDNQKTLAEVAHEINNPLGIMLNYLKLIKTTQEYDQIQTNAGIIEKEIKRVKKILRNITDIKEVPSGQFVERTCIIDAIEDVSVLLRPMMDSNKIHFQISGEKDIFVKIEPDLIKQVLLNIMLNGIEAMPDGGELGVKIFTKTLHDHMHSVIEITDSGIGIPQENIAKIFEPFYTTKDDTESRGLGLSLCQDIIAQLHGFINVESTQQYGTTFQIFLPDSH